MQTPSNLSWALGLTVAELRAVEKFLDHAAAYRYDLTEMREDVSAAIALMEIREIHGGGDADFFVEVAQQFRRQRQS